MVMTIFDALPYISILIVSIALVYGAYEDVKTRIAPKWIWYVTAPFALITTALWYLATVLYGDPTLAFVLFLTTVILCPVCMYMGSVWETAGIGELCFSCRYLHHGLHH